MIDLSNRKKKVFRSLFRNAVSQEGRPTGTWKTNVLLFSLSSHLHCSIKPRQNIWFGFTSVLYKLTVIRFPSFFTFKRSTISFSAVLQATITLVCKIKCWIYLFTPMLVTAKSTQLSSTFVNPALHPRLSPCDWDHCGWWCLRKLKVSAPSISPLSHLLNNPATWPAGRST